MIDAAPQDGQKARASPGQPPAAVSRVAIIMPLVISIAMLLLIFVFVSHNAAAEVVGKAVLITTVLGKFAVLLPPGGLLRTPYHLALLVVYMDLFVGSIAVFNVNLLYRIPRFGKVLRDLKMLGQAVLARNPWMRRATFMGIVAFVMFPLSGTGAIGGALFGELLGMARKRVLTGIALGSVAGAFGMAALAEWLQDVLGEDFEKSWVLKASGLAVILALVAWLTARYKRLAPVLMDLQEKEGGAEGGAGPRGGQE